jgi:SAM-dependent methyltransferase
MSDHERGQVNQSAAEIYEDYFVPALFQDWPGQLANAAHVQPGQRVLDVACGTGVAARAMADRVGPTGSVVGLDVNPGMLAVAERKAPQVEWRTGQAEALPFEDASFDAVVSQFGLMFFEDRRAAIQEMLRVLRPGGRLAIAVWASLDDTPGYAAMVDLLQRLFGDEAADGLRAPYNLGDRQQLQALFADAGLLDAEIVIHSGTARFPSLESWMYTDIRGWTLADMIDDAQFGLLLKEAQSALANFVTADGSVAFPAPAHIVSVSKA